MTITSTPPSQNANKTSRHAHNSPHLQRLDPKKQPAAPRPPSPIGTRPPPPACIAAQFNRPDLLTTNCSCSWTWQPVPGLLPCCNTVYCNPTRPAGLTTRPSLSATRCARRALRWTLTTVDRTPGCGKTYTRTHIHTQTKVSVRGQERNNKEEGKRTTRREEAHLPPLHNQYRTHERASAPCATTKTELPASPFSLLHAHTQARIGDCHCSK